MGWMRGGGRLGGGGPVYRRRATLSFRLFSASKKDLVGSRVNDSNGSEWMSALMHMGGDKRDEGAGDFERVKCGRGGKTGCTGWQKAGPVER